MNKKFLFGAALVGILGFGSCVDNNESPSVTNIREAKAEQLKALAAVENANAQAALIAANAEAKAKEAQAAYFEAQAAYQQAMADYQAAQTEQAKANAEKAIAEAEVAKQRAANELQKLAGELEIALLQQKTELLNAQTAYETAIQNNDRVVKAKLTNLLNAYKNAQDALFEAQKTLAQDQIELARLKAGLLSGAEGYQFQIAQANKQINKWQKENLDMQAYIDTWKSYTREEAQEVIDKAYQEKLALEKDKKAATQKVVEATNTQTLAQNTLNNSDYMKAAKELLPNSKYEIKTFGSVQVKWIGEGVYGVPQEARGKYCAYVPVTKWLYNDYTGYYEETVVEESYIPLFSDAEPDQEWIEYNLVSYPSENGVVSVAKIPYDVYSSYYDLVSGSVAKFIAAVQESQKSTESWLENAAENYDEAVKAQAEAQAAYDKSVAAEKAYTEANQALQDANKAVDAAQKVIDEAGEKATDAQKKALKDAQDAAEAAATKNDEAYDAYIEAGYPYEKETALNNAKVRATQALKNKNEAEYEVAQNKELIADLSANAEVLNNGVVGNAANLKALNEANLAVANAEKDEDLAESAYDQKDAEYNALTQITSSDSNGNNIENTISNYEREIENNERLIAQYQNNIADWEKALKNDNVEVEKAISSLENTIENEKANIEILQKKYDLAKADLDAAMEEETPAE